MKKSLIAISAAALVFAFLGSSAVQATTLSFSATCDNEFYIGISTNPNTAGTQIGYGNNWGATYSGSTSSLPTTTLYLQVFGINWGGPAGFIGEFTLSDAGFKFANGTQHLVTNTTDWYVSSVGYNASPVTPTSWGFNGVGPWGIRGGIASSAEWIWTSNYYGSYAYLTTTLTPTAVPVPPSLLLLAPGLVGLVGLKRRFTK